MAIMFKATYATPYILTHNEWMQHGESKPLKSRKTCR